MKYALSCRTIRERAVVMVAGLLAEHLHCAARPASQTRHRRGQRQGPHRVQRRGAMLLLVAISLIILLVAAALAVDFAHIHLTRAELRTGTDAAARAASEKLGRSGDTDKARQAAIAIARRNVVNGKPLDIRPADIEFGSNRRLASGKFEFIPGDEPPFNTVRVLGDRSANSLGGSVPMLFGPLFGVAEFSPRMSATASHQQRDIALVLDVSGSMSRNNRFAGLSNALDVFLRELEALPEREFVSLQVYSTEARKRIAMTPDLLEIQSAFDEEEPGGWTAIGEGMKVGIDSFGDPLARPGSFKQMIVMTDGNHNTGISPADVAEEALAQKITVHTITFSKGANQNLMRLTAQKTGGIHLHADNDQQLVKVFREVAREIPVILID